MVFKGRFFSSSKKSDSSSNNNSPDGSSNSPRSFGSNSPIRSDKKKPKSAPKEDPQVAGGAGTGLSASYRHAQVKDGSKKKDVKGKESQPQKSTPLKPSSGGSSSAVPKKLASSLAASAAEVKEPSPVSPILASSLGLNRIKTRSGPLPQESFFGFRGDKVSALGTSNLSRHGGGGGGGNGNSGSGSGGKKKEVGSKSRTMPVLDNASATGNWVDNGSNSDNMSTGSAPSRDQSPNVVAPSRLQNGGSSSEAGT